MNKILMLINSPSLTEFMNNPIQAISAMLTSPFGIFGYIFVMFALLAITYSYTRNMFAVGIFIIIYGVVADVLYPASFAVVINMLGIGFIFGEVLYRGFFKDRGD